MRIERHGEPRRIVERSRNLPRHPRVHVESQQILEGFIFRIKPAKVIGEAPHGVEDGSGDMPDGARQLHHGVQESHARAL